MSKSSSVYKTTLGDKTLNRARIIFGVFLIIVVMILGTTIFAESKTGELRKKLAEPFNNLAKAIESAINEETSSLIKNNRVNVFTYSTSNSISSTSAKTITPPKNANTVFKPVVTQTQVQTQTQVAVPTKSYEQSVVEMKAKAEAEYQAALKKQAEWSAAQKAASDQRMKDLEAWSKADLEAWKKAHGF